jgi:hypothetical protein
MQNGERNRHPFKIRSKRVKLDLLVFFRKEENP